MTAVIGLGASTEFFAGDAAARRPLVITAGFALAFRLLRRAVVVFLRHLVNRGFVTARRIPASTIAGFEPPPGYGGRLRTALRVLLTDGRVWTAGASSATPIDFKPTGRKSAPS